MSGQVFRLIERNDFIQANKTFQTADGVVYEGRGIPPDVEINIYPEDAPIEGHASAIGQIMEMIDAG